MRIKIVNSINYNSWGIQSGDVFEAIKSSVNGNYGIFFGESLLFIQKQDAAEIIEEKKTEAEKPEKSELKIMNFAEFFGGQAVKTIEFK